MGDKDRKLSLLERCFCDEAIRKVRERSDEEELSKEKTDTSAHHSRVEHALYEVQTLLNNLVSIESEVRKAARGLEVSEDALGLCPQKRSPAAAGYVAPKENQDADECSLLGEDEVGDLPLQSI